MTVLLKQAFEKMLKGKWIALKKEGKLAGTMFFRID